MLGRGYCGASSKVYRAEKKTPMYEWAHLGIVMVTQPTIHLIPFSTYRIAPMTATASATRGLPFVSAEERSTWAMLSLLHCGLRSYLVDAGAFSGKLDL